MLGDIVDGGRYCRWCCVVMGVVERLLGLLVVGDAVVDESRLFSPPREKLGGDIQVCSLDQEVG